MPVPESPSLIKLDAVDISLHLQQDSSTDYFCEFCEICNTFFADLRGTMLPIILVSTIVKGELLANETVN